MERLGQLHFLNFWFSYCGKTANFSSVLSYLLAKNLFLAITHLFEEISQFRLKNLPPLINLCVLSQDESNGGHMTQVTLTLDTVVRPIFRHKSLVPCDPLMNSAHESAPGVFSKITISLEIKELLSKIGFNL